MILGIIGLALVLWGIYFALQLLRLFVLWVGNNFNLRKTRNAFIAENEEWETEWKTKRANRRELEKKVGHIGWL